MLYCQVNPLTGQKIRSWKCHGENDISQALINAEEAFTKWQRESFEERSAMFRRLSEILRKNQHKYSLVITQEMGKPIAQSRDEIEKCAYVCDYYALNAERYLSFENKASAASRSYIRFDPLGVVLGIMPWNFPFWQVFRFAVPTLMAGNVSILKHAFNVPQCSLLIEEAFKQAGAKEGVFQNLMISNSKAIELILDSRVAAVALTGSEIAGMSVAQAAGKALKPCVLELGGSDPFIVLDDVDLSIVCAAAIKGRIQNSGQSCIAAKRFIILESIHDAFVEELKKQLSNVKMGNPMDPSVDVGPLAKMDLLKKLHRQVMDSVVDGARIEFGGEPLEGEGAYYPPTILTHVRKGQPAYEEELFGPVVAVIKAKDTEDAIRIANDTPYGLGASIWTKKSSHAEHIAGRIQAGCVFINENVMSDPRVPLGGIKRSGYGRELSEYGIREFVNIKTVWVK
jgi:succinate-semialdehyde dehydrogenase / glutarate-semialdehyde dehydrogenase